jgi:hypothetical protein
MDNDFRIDLSEIARSIDGAEIITVFFPILRKTLLIDTRYDVEDDPLVRIMPMVSGPEERLRTIRKLRPNFPAPERIAFIPWPKYMASLVRLGIYDMVEARLQRIGREKPINELRLALKTIQEMEQTEIASAIDGKGYRTLWRAPH